MKNIIALTFLTLFALPMVAQTTDDGFEKFWTDFSPNLKKGDPKAVSAYVDFPFRGFDFKAVLPQAMRDTIVNNDIFLKYYDKFFTKKRITYLLSAPHTKTTMYGEDSEAYAVRYEKDEDHAAWLYFIRDSETKVWKLFGTDNVSK